MEKKNALLRLNDAQHGNLTVVIPKIREFYHGLGDIVIRFDNGDARTITTDDIDTKMTQIEQAITEFYS
ncbi:MAG: hypothetical protein U9N34_00390 [Candidatus Cloacimonadota bacterium]|nr:hypothetical protein [Candidatus Cloacimonadota bacterium]